MILPVTTYSLLLDTGRNMMPVKASLSSSSGKSSPQSRVSSHSKTAERKTPDTMSSSSIKSPMQAQASAMASSNGSGVKRKARASSSELDNGDDTIMTINGHDDHPATHDSKRVRRGGTPGAGASRTNKKDLSAWVAKSGMNPLPLPVPHLTKAILDAGLAPTATAAVSLTPPSSIASLSSGSVLPREMFVFGNGDMGQHGLGTEALDEIKRPRRHAWVAKACDDGRLGKGGLEMVAAGGMHSLAIDSTGRVLSWGINDNAALGRRTNRNPDIEAEVYETEPMPVEGMSPTGVGIVGGPAPLGGTEGPVQKFRATRVAAGDSVSVALSDQGEVRVWGSFRSNDGLLGFDGTVGSDRTQFLPVALPALTKHSFVQVACGDDHVVALTTDGIVYTWGNGQQSQLGRRIIERRKINGLTPERLSIKHIVAIGAGAYHSFAIDKHGNVWAWGLNSLRQTGIDTSEDTIPVPQKVDGLSPSQLGGARVVQITAGQHHSLFLLSDGRVFGAGRCDGFELGIGEDHPAMREVFRKRNAWAAKREEELKVEIPAWEARMEQKKKAQALANGGEAGSMDMVVSEEDMPPRKGPPPDEYVSEPVHIPFPNNAKVTSLACGARHNLAVDNVGVAYSWGFGVSSQLGQGDEEQMETPTPVKSKQLLPFSTVFASAGGQHSILLAVSKGEEAV